MTEREKMQFCYELAFFPPRLNQVWMEIKKDSTGAADKFGALLDIALLLHQALPETGYASQRALNRLALYQAKARAFGTVQFITNIREKLGRPPLTEHIVPGHWVRDIGLPELTRHPTNPANLGTSRISSAPTRLQL